jgi:hypothetical protein
MIAERLEEGQSKVTESVVLNERLRRDAPKDRSSVDEVKQWEKRKVKERRSFSELVVDPPIVARWFSNSSFTNE